MADGGDVGSHLEVEEVIDVGKLPRIIEGDSTLPLGRQSGTSVGLSKC